MKQLKKKKKAENTLLFYIQSSNENCRTNNNCGKTIADDFGRGPFINIPMIVATMCSK